MFKSQRALVVLGIVFSLTTLKVFGQGCSDAGFCTMGAMRPGQAHNKRAAIKLRTIELNQYRGASTLSPVIYATTLDFTLGLGEKTSLHTKLPYLWVEGSLGNTSGLGDVSLSIIRTIHQNDNFSISATVGTKIPTGNSTLDKNGRADYPMYYQTSLGSHDIVFGASLVGRKWQISAGYQQALTRNENEFRYEEWGGFPDQAYLRRYPLANHLKRGIDIMVRVERKFRISNFQFDVGILPIYRITRDEIFDEIIQERVKPDGTTGLALTAVAGSAYHINVNSTLNLMFGLKITERDFNPDGLTRHNVLSLAYIFRF